MGSREVLLSLLDKNQRKQVEKEGSFRMRGAATRKEYQVLANGRYTSRQIRQAATDRTTNCFRVLGRSYDFYLAYHDPQEVGETGYSASIAAYLILSDPEQEKIAHQKVYGGSLK